MTEKKNQIDEEKYKEFEMYLKRFFNENLADKLTDAYSNINESLQTLLAYQDKAETEN